MADTKRNPSRHRAQKLRKTYGMTEADYNALLESQGGKCAVCDQYRKLVVDHSHVTKKVRGLLCSNCNSGLGLFAESKQSLSNAIKYLTTRKT